MRADVLDAITNSPIAVQEQLRGPCSSALNLLDEHLPESESVICLSSAAVRWMNGTLDSVLALTRMRLLFVAPLPQVLSYRLREIESTQATTGSGDVGIFHLAAGDSKFQLGISVQYGQKFETQVGRAAAIARIADL